jgi:hypothetical protein
MAARLIDRRDFVAGAGVAFAAALLPRNAAALAAADAVYGAAFMNPAGEYGLAILSEKGEIISRQPLPARAHGLACNNGQAVAFARRPGNFALAFDPAGIRKPIVFSTPANRHFYGHGVFSPDGALLYAAENDFDHGVGVVGIYDATDGFARLGELPSHGIGPHEVIFAADGRTLCVANGGIQTHPDYGRLKLNLASMEPSIAFVDASTGALEEKHVLPAELSRVSTRHVVVDASRRIWIGGQYEGEASDTPPLIACVALGENLVFLDLPQEQARTLENYIGAVAANAEGDRIAFTAPKGNTLMIVDALKGRIERVVSLDRVCGLARAGDGFVTSSQDGDFGPSHHDLAWDNHIVRLG